MPLLATVIGLVMCGRVTLQVYVFYLLRSGCLKLINFCCLNYLSMNWTIFLRFRLDLIIFTGGLSNLLCVSLLSAANESISDQLLHCLLVGTICCSAYVVISNQFAAHLLSVVA